MILPMCALFLHPAFYQRASGWSQEPARPKGTSLHSISFLFQKLMGGSKKEGYRMEGPHNEDYSIWGSILGSPYFGKLPNNNRKLLERSPNVCKPQWGIC